jgi:transposase-like protein
LPTRWGPEAALSKSTVSRVCAETREQFEAWQQRRLDDIELDYLFVDGTHFKYHATAAAEPVLATWGITTAGKPVFVDLTPRRPSRPTPGTGSCAAWASAACAARCW